MQNNEFIGNVVGDKYRIVKKITTGGMNSTIYEGEAIENNTNNYFNRKTRKAAIKIIKKDADMTDDVWQRINDEVFTLSRMSTKRNVIKFYDSIVDIDQIIIIMEYVDGSSLDNKINEYGHFSLEEGLYLFKEILFGVSQLHNNSLEIIHRDLKPSNILLLKNQTEIRIIDFGISSVFDKTITKDAPQVVTNEESFYGTMAYVAPDIIGIKKYNINELYKRVTRQFDFHSLGVIFHEMMTGEKPLYYENEEDSICLTYYHDYDIRPMKDLIPNMPNEIENIIFRLTATKPNHIKYRYKSIEEIINDIQNYEKRISSNSLESSLLNPINERVFQESPFFNLKIENSKIVSKKWMLATSVSFFIFTIIIFCLVIIWSIIF